MKKHHKITGSERDQIAWWLACGITIREMARRLGRSPSSIAAELKRNQADGVYGSIKADQAAEARKRNSHQKYLLRHCQTLRGFVLEKLKLGGLFSRLPQLARKSTTRDNGSEHYLHTRFQEELGMQTYFADPYCSWQRGTSESTNGLLRRYFPKGTDFQLVSQGAVNEVVAHLNSTPRKVLGYQTPLEVFTAHCASH